MQTVRHIPAGEAVGRALVTESERYRATRDFEAQQAYERGLQRGRAGWVIAVLPLAALLTAETLYIVFN